MNRLKMNPRFECIWQEIIEYDLFLLFLLLFYVEQKDQLANMQKTISRILRFAYKHSTVEL